MLDRIVAAGQKPGAAGAALRDPAVLAAIDKLVAEGRARSATELLRRLLAVSPDEHHLAARLVELLCDRLEFDEAVPYMERLLGSPPHAARARFLLAEAAERRGQLDVARLEYERVLADDIDHPRALPRWSRLRPERAVTAAAPTVAGVAGEQLRVGDRFRLRSELGRGTSGTVYLALDEELEREVALKLLHPHRTARAAAEGRLRAWNEARIAAALRHPGVVAIYDLDEERGLIAMELARGGTLRDRLAHGALSPREALRHGAALFATLAAVHRLGILHRDLKPGNVLFRTPVLVGDEEDLLIGDFGLAQLSGRTQGPRGVGPDDRGDVGDAHDGGDGADIGQREALVNEPLAGTLPFLAPEARRGEPEAASDTWAAGRILEEMLCGPTLRDRSALLRGEPQPASPRLPDDLPHRHRLSALLRALLSPSAAARPSPLDAARALSEIAGDRI